MIPQRVILGLVVGALGLPIVICVLLGLVYLLSAMQDLAGATAVGRVCVATGGLWGIDLVVLVICLGINAIDWREKL